MSTPTRNLTGIPRKLRDNCAEWHNVIQHWNQLSIDGMNVIQQIIDLKLNEQVTTEQDTEEENLEKQSLIRPKLQQLCDIFQEIYDKMVGHVDSMKKLTEQFEQIVSLWKAQQLHQQNVTSDDNDSLPFQTWTVDIFWNMSKEMSEMYIKEVASKRNVLESIAHVSTKPELLFLMAVWIHEPYLELKLKLNLEAMLKETKLK